MEIFLTLLYTLVFAFIIYKFSFFNVNGISRKQLIYLFVIKIGAGISLFLVYSYYSNYSDEADIFKYFADGNIMFNALRENPIDYFKMLTGIGNQSEY